MEICYARLARNVGSKVHGIYRIQAKECSLIENYNNDDMVIRDPVALKGTDWSLMNRGVAKNEHLGGPGCNRNLLNIILKSIRYKIINFHISSYT